MIVFAIILIILYQIPYQFSCTNNKINYLGTSILCKYYELNRITELYECYLYKL